MPAVEECPDPHRFVFVHSGNGNISSALASSFATTAAWIAVGVLGADREGLVAAHRGDSARVIVFEKRQRLSHTRCHSDFPLSISV